MQNDETRSDILTDDELDAVVGGDIDIPGYVYCGDAGPYSAATGCPLTSAFWKAAHGGR